MTQNFYQTLQIYMDNSSELSFIDLKPRTGSYVGRLKAYKRRKHKFTRAYYERMALIRSVKYKLEDRNKKLT